MQTRAPTASGVTLVPWDPESPEHIQRLVQQRIDCGWHAEKPAGLWKKLQTEGSKCIYWIVLPKDDPDADEKLQKHIAARPEQGTPLHDTCTTLRGLHLEPTREAFIPVGHIALDTTHPDADELDFEKPTEAVIWIKSFFVTAALQSTGLGRAAMDTLEAMAASEPLCAKTLLLDTMQKDDQIKLKKPKLSTQEWYERRGYRTIYEVPGFYSDVEVPEAKEFEGFVARTVFMQMDVA